MAAPYREDIPYQVVESDVSASTRESYWLTGSALQSVDGLQVSKYADERALEYIEGRIDAQTLESDLKKYYADTPEDHSRQEEADVVAARITNLFETSSFLFRPSQLMALHKTLFQGILPDEWVGKVRKVNITKPEPVLGGRSAAYADWRMIGETLEYDFEQEKKYHYSLPFDERLVSHFARFIANVWQTHPFREGNTRTVAAFAELYLLSLGIPVDNTPFITNSVLFRDALVRASFSSIKLGIEEDPRYLELFFENVILGTNHDFSKLDLNIHGIRTDEKPPYRAQTEFDTSS